MDAKVQSKNTNESRQEWVVLETRAEYSDVLGLVCDGGLVVWAPPRSVSGPVDCAVVTCGHENTEHVVHSDSPGHQQHQQHQVNINNI